jgi:hypothetical protein
MRGDDREARGSEWIGITARIWMSSISTRYLSSITVAINGGFGSQA